MSHISNALFSKTCQQVLALLYGNPEKSFYINEIIRATGMGPATITRELTRLEEAGILRRVKIGNQQHYQAEPLCPIYGELKVIVTKTLGFAELIRQALLPFKNRIDLAFVFGSMARNIETTGSDIDLLIVGNIRLEEVVQATYSLQESLGRSINPRIYSPSEWSALLKEQGGFIKDIMKNPRLDLIGSSNESG